MSYKGRYKPLNPKKYVGNSSQVIYRSLWERKLMVYCDNNNAVLEWGSEEVIIPYRSPWDGRIHRYFPDFYMKVRQSSGAIKKFIVEVKPKYQTKPPVKNPKRKTKNGIRMCRIGVSTLRSGSLQQNIVRIKIWSLRYSLKII